MIGSEVTFVAMYIFVNPTRFAVTIHRRTSSRRFLRHLYRITPDRAWAVAKGVRAFQHGKVTPFGGGWDWSIAEEDNRE